MTTAAEIIAAIASLDPADMPKIVAAAAARWAAEAPPRTPGAAPATEADQLLDVGETARRLGKSKSWLYHHKDLPFAVKGIGKAPRFSRKGLEQYIAKRHWHAL